MNITISDINIVIDEATGNQTVVFTGCMDIVLASTDNKLDSDRYRDPTDDEVNDTYSAVGKQLIDQIRNKISG